MNQREGSHIKQQDATKATMNHDFNI